MVHERTILFGLTVQAGRKVPYETVNRKESRELFIRHALVQMDYDSRAGFFFHNLKTLEAAEYLQQKGRRVDLVVDDAWLFAFFDQKLPEQIVDGPSFERWRKKAEAVNPELLKLRAQDITLKQDSLQGEGLFPDFIQLGPLRIPLVYRFEPGHSEDGVTALIPIHLLNQIAPEPFEWLVPGLLEEKVQALIKSLPKTYRIHFVPVPAFAQSVLPMLDFGEGSLRQQLSSALKRTGGIQVPLEAFREGLVPIHLQMAFALVDQEDRVIERTRDLAALKQGHRDSSGQSFQKMAGQIWLRQGSIHWDFEDLPPCFDGELKGRPVYGFPAIVDEGKTEGVRLYPTPIEAAQMHSAGLIRLFRCVLVKDLKYLKKQLRISPQVELAYQKLTGYAYPFRDLSSRGDLTEDLIDCLLALVFLEGKPEIRTRAEFDLRLKQAGGELLMQADKVITQVSEILFLSLKVRESLAACKVLKVKEDLELQSQRLLFTGFPAVTPWVHLQHFSRYLKAMLHRLEKSAQDPARDQRQFQGLLPLLERYWRTVEREGGIRVPEQDPYRWALEEYRVSLFAQQLRTAYPVSAKRMDEFWQKRTSDEE
jgi:ATP-dependent helicase HrpA